MKLLTPAERALLERIREASDAPSLVKLFVAKAEKQTFFALAEQGRVTFIVEGETEDGNAKGGGDITPSGREALRLHALLVERGIGVGP